MPPFIQGLQLSKQFFEEAVRPVLAHNAPKLRYAAALIGLGSEVLGFDTPMSTDHNGGPRVMLFLADEHARYADKLNQSLPQKLPHDFQGQVEILTLRGYINDYLGVDLDIILNNQLTPSDWLSLPSQKLLSLTRGAVHHDGVGQLSELRSKLDYYPHDVWMYLLASGWARIGQESRHAGIAPRAGYIGDDLGSRLIATRLVHDMMNLCFLMNRQYPPYSKWFGTAFSKLENCATELTPIFQQIFAAPDWKSREALLGRASTILARMHNGLKITDSLPDQPTQFHDRPFFVIQAGRFAEAIIHQIRRDALRNLAAKNPIGSVWQFSASTDLLENAKLRSAISRLYDQWI